MPASFQTDYQRIEKAICFLQGNFRSQPSLEEVARHVRTSPYHFQRLFKRWAGISPKRFVQFLTVEYAKQLLEESRSLLDVTYQAGLSSPSRLHDLFLAVEAVTAGTFKNRGAGLKIFYGVHPTPFGECLLSVTGQGVCGLVFVGRGEQAGAVAGMQRQWPEAAIAENSRETAVWIRRIFSTAASGKRSELTLLLKGTNFQIKVWEALLQIPEGRVVSYGDLARSIAMPEATRAVAGAVARNPIAYLIPCHRVIRSTGALGGYRWGLARKTAILAWEATHAARQPRA